MVMKHSQATLYVEAFEREELSPSVRARLGSHLAGCAACAARARKAADFGPFFESLPRGLTPSGFNEALERVRRQTLSAIRQERGRPVPWLPHWVLSLPRLPLVVPALAAAALLLFLFLAPAEQGKLTSSASR